VRMSDAEWRIMDAVWKQSPASARDVLERLQGQSTWAYSTVKTYLSRMVEKGFLSVRKEANVSYYAPLVTRNQARRAALRSLVDRAFDGAFGPMMAFLVEDEALSEKDQQRLRAMLEEDARREGPSGDDRPTA